MGRVGINFKCFPMPYSEDQLKNIFKSFDSDRDGCLSKQELIKAFQRLGSQFPGWRAMRALHKADQNGDGFIEIEDELDELVKYALRHGYKISTC